MCLYTGISLLLVSEHVSLCYGFTLSAVLKGILKVEIQGPTARTSKSWADEALAKVEL